MEDYKFQSGVLYIMTSVADSLIGNWIVKFHFSGKTIIHHMVITKLSHIGSKPCESDPVSGVMRPFSFNANGWHEDDSSYKWQSDWCPVSCYSPYPVGEVYLRYIAPKKGPYIHLWGNLSPGYKHMSGKANASAPNTTMTYGTFDAYKEEI
jgi:hypothetical protein